MWRINNAILDPKKITVVLQEKGDVNTVLLIFDNGFELRFEGAEAAELWKRLDEEGDWREG